MMRKIIYSCLALFFLAHLASAAPCWFCTLDPACDSDLCVFYGAPLHTCYPKGRLLGWTCNECPPPEKAHCADYTFENACRNDPCGAAGSGGGGCNWSDSGFCHAGCRGWGDETSCRDHTCLPKYNSDGDFIDCYDCPIDFKCDNYENDVDCSDNVCKIGGGCVWWGDSCITDSDKDGCPDLHDNCPGVPNINVDGKMNNTYCDDGVDCDDEGDACDDTDGDGLTDEQEKSMPGMHPRNTDANGNCIPDGVEHGFDPIIRILSGVAVAVATVMLGYLGVGWLTADTPAKRSNAKKGVVYIVAGMIILAGGKDMVIFLFQGSCGVPDYKGQGCDSDCTKACPSAPAGGGGGGGSSPFIYSYDGSSFILEHDGFPFAVLPSWEYETFATLLFLGVEDGFARIRLAEDLAYNTFVNRLRVFRVVHSLGTRVVPDVDGGVHTVRDLVPPSSCSEEDGSDCIGSMGVDGIYWRSSTDDKRLIDSDGDGVIDVYSREDLYDGIILSFPNPEGMTQAKLVLKARESGEVGFAWHSFQRELGEGFWMRIVDLSRMKPFKSLLGSLRDREGVLNIRVWESGSWVQTAGLGVGPQIPAEYVFLLSVPADETVKVKLDSSVLAYEIDYALVDFGVDEVENVEQVNLNVAESSSCLAGDDISGKLGLDDESYVLLNQGDCVELTFPVLEGNGFETSFVVGLKGYYLPAGVDSFNDGFSSLLRAVRFVFEPDYPVRYSYKRFVEGEGG